MRPQDWCQQSTRSTQKVGELSLRLVQQSQLSPLPRPHPSTFALYCPTEAPSSNPPTRPHLSSPSFSSDLHCCLSMMNTLVFFPSSSRILSNQFKDIMMMPHLCADCCTMTIGSRLQRSNQCVWKC